MENKNNDWENTQIGRTYQIRTLYCFDDEFEDDEEDSFTFESVTSGDNFPLETIRMWMEIRSFDTNHQEYYIFRIVYIDNQEELTDFQDWVRQTGDTKIEEIRNF